MDVATRAKWDRAAATFDLMSSRGPEWRWEPAKRKFFSAMRGKILFLAVGTGLDIPFFPPGHPRLVRTPTRGSSNCSKWMCTT